MFLFLKSVDKAFEPSTIARISLNVSNCRQFSNLIEFKISFNELSSLKK